MSDQSTSSPSLSASSPPSSVPPSPELGKLNISNEVSEEDKQEAARLKAAANKAFTCQFSDPTVNQFPVLLTRLGPFRPWFLHVAHDFNDAAKLYSEAIEKNPNEPTLWCNRAYARMKLEEYGYALTDASRVGFLCYKWDIAHVRAALL